MSVTILDGPLGTQLNAHGLETPAPLWSAAALRSHPQLVQRIHRAYADAGAQVHTANTFRTRRRSAGAQWRELAEEAIRLARAALPPGATLAGSIAPLEDCYRPDRSPPAPGAEHAELAAALAALGCDLLLCETFPHVGEGLAAVSAAVATGLPTWAAFTAGYRADLLTPGALAQAAREAEARGAQAVLVNCVPASQTLRYVRALADSGIQVPFGAYANAGHPTEGLGWVSTDDGPARYAALAQGWVDAGATLVGSCCGTGPDTIAALARCFQTHDAPTGSAGASAS